MNDSEKTKTSSNRPDREERATEIAIRLLCEEIDGCDSVSAAYTMALRFLELEDRARVQRLEMDKKIAK